MSLVDEISLEGLQLFEAERAVNAAYKKAENGEPILKDEGRIFVSLIQKR